MNNELEMAKLEIAHCHAVCAELRGKLEAVSAQNSELVAMVELLAKDRDEWKEAAAKVISVMQLSGVKVNNDYFTKCLRQIQADAAASALNAEADLILAAPADAKAAGNIWSESDQKVVLRIGSMLKSRAALLRAKDGQQ